MIRRLFMVLFAVAITMFFVQRCAHETGTRREGPARLNKGEIDGRFSFEIRQVVASRLNDLRMLYNEELRITPGLRGKMVIEFEIAPSGEVTETKLISSTLKSPDLEQAILENIATWVFPPIPEENGRVKVTYPFIFKPPSEGFR